MCHDCPECLRLWRQYSKAAIRHLRFRHQIEVASVLGDVPPSSQLVRAAAIADNERHKLLEVLRQHEVSVHSDQARPHQNLAS